MAKKRKIVDELVRKNVLCPFSTPDGKYWIEVADGETRKVFNPRDNDFLMVLRDLTKKCDGEGLSVGDCKDEIADLEFYAYQHPSERNLAHRIAYNRTENCIYYDADANHGCAYKIDVKGYEEITTPSMVFQQNTTYAAQVAPDTDAEAYELPELVRKHFRFKNEEDRMLFSIYLVTTFLNPLINVPMLILQGEKGSSKSSILRRIERIVDPKSTDVMGAPRSDADLEIRLNNSYFTTLDNLSYISKRTSDLLARAITGGSSSRRQLYSNTKEVSLDLRCVIALNGIGLVATEADLLDRSIVFKLRRIPQSEIRTEKELEETFSEDLPKILGAIFLCISEVFADEEPVTLQKRTRMADWFELAVKVGRIFGMEDDETAKIIWKNHRAVNQQTLGENLIAQCILELMGSEKEYFGSVTDLLGDLCEIAERNAIKSSQLPGQPNVLSRRLNELKSNLEEAGVFFEIKNVGPFRQIHIWKTKKRRKSKN